MNMDNIYIWHIEAAPYICTVPGGGLRATKCYPDAQTFFVNGQKIGYSRKSHTLIVPIGSNENEIKTYMTSVLRALTALDRRRTEQGKNFPFCFVNSIRNRDGR